jgi:hypothetical protein
LHIFGTVWWLKHPLKQKYLNWYLRSFFIFSLFKHRKITQLPIKNYLKKWFPRVFLYFHPIFLVIISLNKGKFGILINIKYYLKNKNGWRVQCTRQHVSYPDALWAACEGSGNVQKVAFRAAFKSYRLPLHT